MVWGGWVAIQLFEKGATEPRYVRREKTGMVRVCEGEVRGRRRREFKKTEGGRKSEIWVLQKDLVLAPPLPAYDPLQIAPKIM